MSGVATEPNSIRRAEWKRYLISLRGMHQKGLHSQFHRRRSAFRTLRLKHYLGKIVQSPVTVLSVIHKSKVSWVAAIAKLSVWRQPQEALDRCATANSCCLVIPHGMRGLLSASPTQVVKKGSSENFVGNRLETTSVQTCAGHQGKSTLGDFRCSGNHQSFDQPPPKQF